MSGVPCTANRDQLRLLADVWSRFLPLRNPVEGVVIVVSPRNTVVDSSPGHWKSDQPQWTQRTGLLVTRVIKTVVSVLGGGGVLGGVLNLEV